MSEPLNNPWRHRFAVLTAIATFLLLAAGGLVTSHDVGMAVPDWPNTYGYNMFFFPWSQWVGGIFYEHTHRLIASGVGLLTGVLALWLYGKPARPFMRWSGLILVLLGIAIELLVPARWADGIVSGATGLVMFGASFAWPRCEPAAKWLRRLGLAAFFAVVLQGVLGGLRVILFKDQLGIVHATLAQLFFALVCAIALFTGKWWMELERAGPRAGPAPGAPKMRRWFVGATALILFQLILGAAMRHQHAGLAIPDFPLAYGKLWPATDPDSVALYNERRIEVTAANPITSFQIELQMAHRLAAVLILAAVALCARRAQAVGAAQISRSGPAEGGTSNLPYRLALFWLALILAQAGLGATTIFTNKAADVATAHVLVGALSLATGVLLCILPVRNPESTRQAPALSAKADERGRGSLDAKTAAAQPS